MVTGIIGKKVGMTQLFDADGTVHPATVLKAGPCVVAQVKTVGADGYEAVQLGWSRRSRKENKPTHRPFQEGGRPADSRAPRGEAAKGDDPLKPGDQVNVAFSLMESAWTSSRRAAARASRAWLSGITSRGGRASHGSMFHRAPARSAPPRSRRAWSRACGWPATWAPIA